MQKNVASQKKIYFAFDSTTNAPKTGDAANITPYVSLDYGSVNAITDTSMTEMDATNAKGYYICDLTQAETNGNENLYTAKSSTANIVVVGAPALVVTDPPNASLLSVDSNGRLDVIKVAGTTQTARDIGASVLLSSGTGTGQLKLASGYVAMTWADIAAPTTVVGLTGTTVKTATDVETDTADIQTRLPAALSSGNMKCDALAISTSATAADNLELAGLAYSTTRGLSGTALPAAAADAAGGLVISDAGGLDADAQRSDVAAILVDTGTTLDGRIPAALTGAGNMKSDMLAISGSVAAADDLEESTEAIGYGTVDGTGASVTAFLTSALTPDSAVNDQFNGRVLIFKNDTTTTALRGQATTISDWAHSSGEVGTFTVVALTTAPQSGDTFVIL